MDPPAITEFLAYKIRSLTEQEDSRNGNLERMAYKRIWNEVLGKAICSVLVFRALRLSVGGRLQFTAMWLLNHIYLIFWGQTASKTFAQQQKTVCLKCAREMNKFNDFFLISAVCCESQC